METKGEAEKEKLVEMLYSLIKDDSDEESPKKTTSREPSPIISRSVSISSKSRSRSSRSSRSSLRSSRSSSRSVRSSSSSTSRSRRSRSRTRHVSDNQEFIPKDDLKLNEIKDSLNPSDNNEVIDDNCDNFEKSTRDDKSRTPSPVELDLNGILEAITPQPSSPAEPETLKILPPTRPLNIRLPNFKYKPHHAYLPAQDDLPPVFSVHQLTQTHPAFCRAEVILQSERKSKKHKIKSVATFPPSSCSDNKSISDSDCDVKTSKGNRTVKKSKKPRIAAAKRKSGQSFAAKIKVSTAFSSHTYNFHAYFF